MPYKEIKKKNGKYEVKGPSGVHAKNSTKANADKQIRLLHALENGVEGFRKKNK